MTFFRERNNIKIEYSGHQAISDELRKKLIAVVRSRSSSNIGLGNERFFLSRRKLDHEVEIRFGEKALEVLAQGTYDQVFEVVEIFLLLTEEYLNHDVYEKQLLDVHTALYTSGSVYSLNQNGKIVLQLSEETSKNASIVEEIMTKRTEQGVGFFKKALRDLLSRERDANDIVKDFSVALEDYLKKLMNQDSYEKAITLLKTQEIITPTQKALVDKLYAYRGDSHGVAHASDSRVPEEVDAVWFLETLIAQVKLIDARMKVKNTQL